MMKNQTDRRNTIPPSSHWLRLTASVRQRWFCRSPRSSSWRPGRGCPCTRACRLSSCPARGWRRASGRPWSMAACCATPAATLLEVLLGLLAGSLWPPSLGYLLARSPRPGTPALPLPGRQPGRADGGHRSAAGDLVRPGDVLQGAHLRPDRLLPGAGQHRGRAAGGAARTCAT